MQIEMYMSGVLVYMLVLVRFAGMILFNPILARTGIPAIVRMGLVVFLTLMFAPMQPVDAVLAMTTLQYTWAAVKELFLGFVYGFVFQIFYYLMYTAGDQIDTDIGLSMAKSFDPATNIQAGFSSSFLVTLFALYFFATNSHLALFNMFGTTFEQIPLGVFTISTNIFSFIIDLFVSIFLLVLRLAAPFMVAEFILQASMGILMKFIPQITVFVINFQLRIMLGILMLFLFAPFISDFIDRYLVVLFDNLVDIPAVLASG